MLRSRCVTRGPTHHPRPHHLDHTPVTTRCSRNSHHCTPAHAVIPAQKHSASASRIEITDIAVNNLLQRHVEIADENLGGVPRREFLSLSLPWPPSYSSWRGRGLRGHGESGEVGGGRWGPGEAVSGLGIQERSCELLWMTPAATAVVHGDDVAAVVVLRRVRVRRVMHLLFPRLQHAREVPGNTMRCLSAGHRRPLASEDSVKTICVHRTGAQGQIAVRIPGEIEAVESFTLVRGQLEAQQHLAQSWTLTSTDSRADEHALLQNPTPHFTWRQV